MKILQYGTYEFDNLFDADATICESFGRFAGRTVAYYGCANSFVFSTLARGLDYIKNTPACVGVTYDAEIHYMGDIVPVKITLEGTEIDGKIKLIVGSIREL